MIVDSQCDLFVSAVIDTCQRFSKIDTVELTVSEEPVEGIHEKVFVEVEFE